MKVYTPTGLRDKIKLWALRAIFECDGVYDLVIRNDDVCELFRIPCDLEKKDAPKVSKMLKDELRRLEELNEAGKIGSNANLNANLELVKNTLGLSQTERDLLEFFAASKSIGVLKELMRDIKVDTSQLSFFISKVLGARLNLVKSALKANSALLSCKIIKLNKNCYRPDFDDLIEFCDDDFPFNLIELKKPSIDMLFAGILRKCSSPKLEISDYEHLSIKTDDILEYLKNCQKGANILLHGLPGTGKTEFCKAIASRLKKELFEVAFCDDDGDSLNSLERFSSLICANALLEAKNSVILFDEVEDIFRDRHISKALINRTLEENRVPTFWLTNDVYSMDNAYIRRFDMVIEFKIPPKTKRKELIKNYTKGAVCEKTINKLAKNKDIAPALISSASKVLNTLKVENEKERNKLFTTLIEGNLNAQGKLRIESKKSKKSKGIELPQSYDTSYINTSIDPQAMVAGIKERPNARICLYGVAGTGKSAYAKFIASELGCEIIIKKASEILGMYVGQTEKNIANAFKEAKNKKAVLVFDEVDSFLQDRSTANRSWEISQVNEMLVQMESFNGVFIATTNLCESLDKASLRRFDMKIEFGYLKPEQASALFKKECELLGLKINAGALERVSSLRALAPGDFAAVKRANAFYPIKDSDDFAKRLADEVKIKNAESGSKLGFVR